MRMHRDIATHACIVKHCMRVRSFNILEKFQVGRYQIGVAYSLHTQQRVEESFPGAWTIANCCMSETKKALNSPNFATTSSSHKRDNYGYGLIPRKIRGMGSSCEKYGQTCSSYHMKGRYLLLKSLRDGCRSHSSSYIVAYLHANGRLPFS